MPRLKCNQNKDAKIVSVVWGQMAAMGITVSDLAQRTGIGEGTLYRRKKAPETFTVAELTKIGRNLGVPIEDLRSAIRY